MHSHIMNNLSTVLHICHSFYSCCSLHHSWLEKFFVRRNSRHIVFVNTKVVLSTCRWGCSLVGNEAVVVSAVVATVVVVDVSEFCHSFYTCYSHQSTKA